MLFPEAPKDLISKLLVVDPKRRFTIEQALQHDFFQVLVRSFIVALVELHSALLLCKTHFISCC